MNRKNKQMMLRFVVLALLLIGVVYAVLQANLQINGIAKIQSNTWDIHFDNIQVSDDSVSIGTGDSAATIDPNDTSKVDFSVTLGVPGDFYEFTVDVVNVGTIDGMIGELTKTLKVNNEVVSEAPDYLDFSVTYDDGAPLIPNHLLAAGDTLTYLVRLEFRSDIEELPDATTVVTSLEPQYIQADEGAIKKQPYYACTYDGELVQGAEYTDGQYTYRYMQEYGTTSNPNYSASSYAWRNIENDGWGVTLTDKESTDPVTTRLCSSINDKPIVSMSSMFGASQTTSIDTSSFDTSKVVSMESMFLEATGFSSIDLQDFDMSELTNMSYMFFKATGLQSLDMSHLGGDKLTQMKQLLPSSGSLTTVDMSYFNFGAITHLGTLDNSYAFKNRNSIVDLNLSHANMKNMTTLGSAFSGMSHLKYLDLSYVDMRNVIGMGNFARDNPVLETIDMSYAKTDKNESFYYAFKQSYKLKNIIFTGISMENITDTRYMFYDNDELVSVDLSMFRTPNLVQASYMFYYNDKLEEVNLSNWGGNSVTTINGLLRDNPSLKKVTMDNFNFGSANLFNDHFGSANIEEISMRYSIATNTTNCGKMFGSSYYYLQHLKKLDMTGFVFGVDASYFLNYAPTTLTTLILDNIDTSHVTTMSYTFAHTPFTTLDLTNWDVSHVTNMDSIFFNNSYLTTIDITGWDTSNVTNMTTFFTSSAQLHTIYANESFVTTSVTNPNTDLFGSCTSLVGGNGTAYASGNYGMAFAVVDAPGTPGYFTRKGTV